MTSKVIDADSHILEPGDLWMEYIEPKYRDRALKIAEDEKGLEYLSVDGKPSWFAQGGTLGALGAIGQDATRIWNPGVSSGKTLCSPVATTLTNGSR